MRGSKGKGEISRFPDSCVRARVCVCVDCALPSEWCLRAGSRKTRVSLNISNELRAFSGKSFWMDWIFMLKFIKKYIFYKFSIYKIYFFKIWN